jgi:hypothetical protein
MLKPVCVLQVYETMSPVLEAYESQGKLRTVNGAATKAGEVPS